MLLFLAYFCSFLLIYSFLLSDLKTLSFILSYCSILFIYWEMACYTWDLNLDNLLFIMHVALFIKNRLYLELLSLLDIIGLIRSICTIANIYISFLFDWQKIIWIYFAKTHDLQKNERYFNGNSNFVVILLNFLIF